MIVLSSECVFLSEIAATGTEWPAGASKNEKLFRFPVPMDPPSVAYRSALMSLERLDSMPDQRGAINTIIRKYGCFRNYLDVPWWAVM
jgi:hypothetical protein